MIRELELGETFRWILPSTQRQQRMPSGADKNLIKSYYCTFILQDGTSLQPRMYRAHSKQIWTTGVLDTDLANGSSILSYDYHTLYARVGSMPEVGVGPGKTQPLFSDHS